MSENDASVAFFMLLGGSTFLSGLISTMILVPQDDNPSTHVGVIGFSTFTAAGLAIMIVAAAFKMYTRKKEVQPLPRNEAALPDEEPRVFEWVPIGSGLQSRAGNLQQTAVNPQPTAGYVQQTAINPQPTAGYVQQTAINPQPTTAPAP